MRYLLTILGLLFAGVFPPQTEKYEALRRRMVEDQIVSRGISDRKTLEALRKVPRHLFVPADMQDFAYNDNPLPIGYNQTISQPYIVALMTELTGPGRGKKALEIGTGSGYQAAILAEIVDTVYTIEIVPKLARESAGLFERLGYKNIVTRYGDGYQGWPEHAPFDIIIVTAAPRDIPHPLLDQLAEGGKLVIPVGLPSSFQELILATKKNGRITKQKITTVRFVPFKRLDP